MFYFGKVRFVMLDKLIFNVVSFAFGVNTEAATVSFGLGGGAIRLLHETIYTLLAKSI